MPSQRKRLRQSESLDLLDEFTKQYGSLDRSTEEHPRVEILKVNEKAIFFIDETPSILKIGQKLFPTLVFYMVLGRLPRVVVDMGAVPHICNGADIMAPGVRDVQGDFPAESVVAVVEDKYGKYLAIGETTMDSDELRKTKEGKVIRNEHYVGDDVWSHLSTTRR